MPNIQTIKARIAKLEKQAADLLNKERTSVIAKVTAYIRDYALTLADLGFKGRKGAQLRTGKSPAAATRSKGVPKYRDPETGKTWTGRGKPPGWIVAAIKRGKKDDFLIDRMPTPPAPKQAAAKGKSKRAAAKPAAPRGKKGNGKPAARKQAAGGRKAAKPAAKATPAVSAPSQAPAAG